MPKVTFSREDFLQKNPLDPGWYVFEVGDFTQAPSRDGESTNFWGDFKVADGPKAGVPVRKCFNEKGIGMSGGAADFISCFVDNPLDKLVGVDIIDVLKQTTGRKVEGFGQWDPTRRWNSIEDWRPVKS